MEPVRAIRERLRRELPPETFAPTPARAWLCVPLNLLVAAAFTVVARKRLPWYARLGIGVGLGQVYATLGFWAHDLLHGSIVRSRRRQDAISYFGLYPFLLSPITWRLWHVQAHHGNTQTSRDPDALVTLEEYHRTPIARLYLKLAPSSRNRLGALPFYTLWFTLHGQEILWFGQMHEDWKIETYRFKRKRAMLETLAVIAFWVGVCAKVGPLNSVFVVLLPMLLGNVILMSFISTQHTILPRSTDTRGGHALENTMSVRVPWIFEKLNLNFNHHVEHHLFPSMNYSKLPIVRRWLREHYPDEYVQPPLSQAVRAFLSTPRVYADRTKLCFPANPDDAHVDTVDIRQRLIAENTSPSR